LDKIPPGRALIAGDDPVVRREFSDGLETVSWSESVELSPGQDVNLGVVPMKRVKFGIGYY
jgi:hypothetical protein